MESRAKREWADEVAKKINQGLQGECLNIPVGSILPINLTEVLSNILTKMQIPKVPV